ncbi:DUF1987 domain-containing protein [Marinoscillum sp. MHG1-6]|uniref:DUF1987 domain-containing protein n=1 Tax=Marinoscillum sp. MHG1-6 TaxID=2959627 RepID=UPI0021577D40|nr:DUF1987 domain-containing protein [Marinoscillum sp. MHG1-6]
MIDIFIESTQTTPLVKIDCSEGLISFKGKSSPENSLGFYHPLIENIKTLFADIDRPINANLAFRYFNTSSSKCLFDLFKALKFLMVEKARNVKINWYYEEDDEDMMETGEDFADLLDIEFNMVPVEYISEITLSKAV